MLNLTFSIKDTLRSEKANRLHERWKKRANYSYYNYVRSNPEIYLRMKVRTKVYYAIKTGKLVRQGCEVPNCQNRAEAHHNDYNQPLVVVWLCRIHHSKLHSEMKRMQRQN